MTALKVHPAADLFPMMGETELAELAADIAASGQREPIAITPKDEVLDGRNRLAACKIAKVTPITKLVETDDPVAYVVSLNVKRRNLTVGQRAIAAAESWPMFGGPPQRGGDRTKDRHPSLTHEGMAKLWGVSKDSIVKATALVEEDPVGASEVKGGGSLEAAHKTLQDRKRDIELREAAMERLRVRHPDLSEMVTAGKLSLEDATAVVREREREETEIRSTNTRFIADLAAFSTPIEHALDFVSNYDPEFDPRKSVTPESLRKVAAFATEVANLIEKEKP